MKMAKIGLSGLAVGMGLFIAGCKLDPFQTEFVMPSNKISEVSKVNVVSLKIKTNVRGNRAGSKEMNEALIRQLISSRLYQNGYYRVVDDFWGGEGAPDKIAAVLANANEAGHLYASYSSGGAVPASKICPQCGTICPEHRLTLADVSMKVKAELEIVCDLELGVTEADEMQAVTLNTTTYKIVQPKKPNMPPEAHPVQGPSVTKQVPVHTFRSAGKGTITARLNGVHGEKCPVNYSNTFQVSLSDAKLPYNACLSNPSQLKLLTALVSPAVDQLLADISPHKEKAMVQPAKGGAEDVVTLLYAQAFDEVIAYVGELDRTHEAKAADYVNMGHALAVKGQFSKALKIYRKAAKLAPEDAELAKAGIAHMEKMLAASTAVKAAGPGNTDTQFKKAK